MIYKSEIINDFMELFYKNDTKKIINLICKSDTMYKSFTKEFILKYNENKNEINKEMLEKAYKIFPIGSKFNRYGYYGIINELKVNFGYYICMWDVFEIVNVNDKNSIPISIWDFEKGFGFAKTV